MEGLLKAPNGCRLVLNCCSCGSRSSAPIGFRVPGILGRVVSELRVEILPTGINLAIVSCGCTELCAGLLGKQTRGSYVLQVDAC
jgi:hypothetical protein